MLYARLRLLSLANEKTEDIGVEDPYRLEKIVEDISSGADEYAGRGGIL